jgi:hypothetical protein
MKPTVSSAPSARGLRRVGFYYVLFGALLWLGVRFLPVLSEVLAGATSLRGSSASAVEAFGLDSPLPVADPLSPDVWYNALLASMSMLGALAIMVPVTWVYMITRRHRGYEESVVHTLFILPVAVTGIVMIVKNNVALAFSLAGIVAAVRFRTTLEDTKDAVYVFLAIGVGVACGVQELGIALVLSVIFNGVVLGLWRTRFGNIYADQNARSGPIGLGDVLAGPGSAASALQVGDPSILEAAAPSDLAEIAERAVRMERHIREERAKKKSKRANALLLVHAPAAEPAQALVESILEEASHRWKLVEVVPGPDGVLLEFLARLETPASHGAVIDRIREESAGVVSAVELRSLSGLKPKA